MPATGQNNSPRWLGATAFNFIDLGQCAILVLLPLNGQKLARLSRQARLKHSNL
jgi:hypothetical protein